MARSGFFLCGVVLALAACSQPDRNSNDTLINLRSASVSPDEFLVMPQKPLETPESLTDLPEPTPGGTNLADLDTTNTAITALGGRGNGRGIPGSEAALVQAVRASGGTEPGIRETLRAEDQAYREDRSRRLARLEEDFEANLIYSRMMLDPYAELERLKGKGVRLPTAPPGRGGGPRLNLPQLFGR